MNPYWALFATAVVLAITGWPRSWGSIAKYSYGVLAPALALFIGYRFMVGGDWFNYEVMFLNIAQSNFGSAIAISDPAYSLINWGVGQAGGDVWHVNLLCAVLFVYGLMRFLNLLPSPGTGLVAAVPTVIIVIAMGYTRQACAIACIMLAATEFKSRFDMRWIAWLALGVAFHKSTIFVFPIFFFAATENRTVSIIAGAAIGVVLLNLLILGNIEALLILYVDADQQSSGAAVRIALALVTAVAFLVMPRSREMLAERYTLWRNMAIASLALVPAFILVQSSTIVDRIGVLFLPLQLVVFSALANSVARTPTLRGAMFVAIASFQLAVLAVWLYFGANSSAWVPYQNVLFEAYL